MKAEGWTKILKRMWRPLGAYQYRATMIDGLKCTPFWSSHATIGGKPCAELWHWDFDFICLSRFVLHALWCVHLVAKVFCTQMLHWAAHPSQVRLSSSDPSSRNSFANLISHLPSHPIAPSWGPHLIQNACAGKQTHMSNTCSPSGAIRHQEGLN